MHLVRVVVDVTLFIIACAITKVEGQSPIDDPNSDSFVIAALDQPNKDSTFPNFFPDDNIAPDNILPDEQSLGSGDVQDLDISSLTGDSTYISDANNCQGNRNKRKDRGSTLGNYFPPPKPLLSLN